MLPAVNDYSNTLQKPTMFDMPPTDESRGVSRGQLAQSSSHDLHEGSAHQSSVQKEI